MSCKQNFEATFIGSPPSGAEVIAIIADLYARQTGQEYDLIVRDSSGAILQQKTCGRAAG